MIGGGLPVDCPVHLVLHRGEKALGCFLGGVVVDAGGVNVQHLAPEHFFRRADVADARQQFIEVVAATRAFEPLVVEREALDDVFPQALRGPDPELDTAMRFDAVTDRDDDVEVEIFDITTDGLATFGLNCCKFCNSSLGSVRPPRMFLICTEITDLSRWNRCSSDRAITKRSRPSCGFPAASDHLRSDRAELHRRVEICRDPSAVRQRVTSGNQDVVPWLPITISQGYFKVIW